MGPGEGFGDVAAMADMHAEEAQEAGPWILAKGQKNNERPFELIGRGNSPLPFCFNKFGWLEHKPVLHYVAIVAIVQVR